jgi:hypothetical protein
MTVAMAPVADRPFASDEELEELVSGFENRSLPKARWTHRAHLAVGLVYCDRMPAPVALALLRERIRRCNVAIGGENSSTAGYHETITRFYVYIVRRFIAEDRDERTLSERANRLFERYGARDLPRHYYSEARLFSTEARASWVEPDLRPLD